MNKQNLKGLRVDRVLLLVLIGALVLSILVHASMYLGTYVTSAEVYSISTDGTEYRIIDSDEIFKDGDVTNRKVGDIVSLRMNRGILCTVEDDSIVRVYD